MGEAKDIVGDWGVDKSHAGEQKSVGSAFVGCVTEGCLPQTVPNHQPKG